VIHDDRVHPTRDDPVVTSLSESVGGPLGSRAGRHPWWTPVRVVLALTALCFALGMVQKAPCFQDSWQDGSARYTHMCYSDLPYLYSWPYTGDEQVRGRYEVMEYPVGIAYFAWATAWATHWASGSPEIEPRYAVPADSLFAQEDVAREVRLFVALSAIGFALAALLSAWFLAGVNPRRPWDAALFALSPVLALNALINWDLLAVVLVAGALWAWARDRPVATGVLIGLGTATKLFPLLLLGGLLVICVRDRRLRDFGVAACSAAAAWVLANLPAYVTGSEQWRVFWQFNADRGADLGSIWLVLTESLEISVDAGTVNLGSWLFLGAWCLGVLVLGLKAPQTPRLAQLAFLVVAGLLLVNKVYSPQYVLWLLPLAVLARPRWRDQLIWQAGEIFYFASVWWYLGGDLDSAGGGDAGFYWLAIVVRILAELYLVIIVARDVARPELDPVDRGQATITRSNVVAV
jgi:uncharacterized membrane protein